MARIKRIAFDVEVVSTLVLLLLSVIALFTT